MNATTEAPRLSDDASAILLLCGTLASRGRGGEAPLTVSEYATLAEALRALDARPGNLLRGERSLFSELVAHVPTKARERLSVQRIQRLLERGGQLALAVTRWSGAGIWIVTRADPAYPSRYRQKLGKSAPPILFGVGGQQLVERGGLAIVGSRDPDPSSVEFSREVGHWCASSNVQVVSGAAQGVDSMSMIACMEREGTAVGIVAESLLRLSTRREFREHIIAHRLALLSSHDPEAGFSVGIAMARNRLVYGLADVALVVACSEGSGGTWAGAVEALKCGSRVFVRTGKVERPGNDALLRHGALPVPADFALMLRESDAATATVSALREGSTESSPVAGDIFALAKPLIVALLREPAKLGDVATSLDLTPSQAKAWLAKLCQSGDVVQARSLYQARDSAPNSSANGVAQLLLIDAPPRKGSAKKRTSRGKKPASRD